LACEQRLNAIALARRVQLASGLTLTAICDLCTVHWVQKSRAHRQTGLLHGPVRWTVALHCFQRYSSHTTIWYVDPTWSDGISVEPWIY